jgi:hypothetical protein
MVIRMAFGKNDYICVEDMENGHMNENRLLKAIILAQQISANDSIHVRVDIRKHGFTVYHDKECMKHVDCLDGRKIKIQWHPYSKAQRTNLDLVNILQSLGIPKQSEVRIWLSNYSYIGISINPYISCDNEGYIITESIYVELVRKILSSALSTKISQLQDGELFTY